MTRWTVLSIGLFIIVGLAGDGAGALEPETSGPARVLLPAQRISLSTPLGEDVFLVEGFNGKEGLSQLFSFQLDLLAPNDRDVPFEALIGEAMLITMTSHGAGQRHFSGICKSLTQRGRSGAVTRYRAEIVPRLWLLTRRSGSRIYQNLSVPQIVARVLDGVPGLSKEFRLQGELPPRNYAVQYNETDFDFVSRLLQEEGIYYFFEHSAAGHLMVLANTPAGHAELPAPLAYRPAAVAHAPAGSIFTWETTQELRSGKVTLWDHNFELPHQNLEATATIQPTAAAGQVLHHLQIAGNDALEIYDYPGEYAQRFDGIAPDGGEQPGELAKILPEAQRTVELRVQEEAADSLTMSGTSADARLVSGHKFQLAGHFDADGRYVLTGVTHTARTMPGTNAVVYRNSFTCIPESLPFRPPRTTPKPIIPGTQTAVVVGPPGEEIFVDKYGRVKVQFHWDREGARDQNASCWIRVAQPHAGAGSPFLPRVGWEVVVSFEEGDPDQPIILGSVYNAEHLPPATTPVP